MVFIKKIKSLVGSFIHIIGLRKTIYLILSFINAFTIRNAVMQIDKRSPFNEPLGKNGMLVTNTSMEATNGSFFSL